ncbi:hypothetical protein N7462_010449 [Penicillium macrosclerotiorum]|uniref:uncharacterized protein n=1 Tax=Penicillium macrosclerotiorum TaxID=303699 RepID=UPI002548FB53|nr:uncharacterized protein N7462_010449 [Penicillium macrosclerotiorum]KAJ5669379.1 hypothetical protein N7462_010449 [Penicillium macrosclerotiorum]
MAYTDDSVKAKLSALNESQESIVTVAQWVMFHRRHADRTAQIWLQKIRDSAPPKRLNLIYLANEVAQQSKARQKEDFIIAFSPIIAEATATAYKGASSDIQLKLRRVLEVWRQRNVFEGPILDAVDARVNEIDKTRSTTKKQPLGGSFFKDSSAGATPSELQPLVPLQVALTKVAMSSNTSSTTANTEYEKLNSPEAPKLTPPVHAARLGALLKALAHAESSVSEVIKSRRALIDGLEKFLATNRSELKKEESLVAHFTSKKDETDAKRREVEEAIMRGYPTDEGSGMAQGGSEGDFPRPEVEALTPPPVEAITPVGSPKPLQTQGQMTHGPFTEDTEMPLPEGFTLPGLEQSDNGIAFPDAASLSPGGGNDFDLGANGAGAKRRKTTHEDEDYAQFASGDLDADVAEMIAQEGRM